MVSSTASGGASRTAFKRAFTIATLAGAVAAGAFSWESSSAPMQGSQADQAMSFTSADAGSCLTWDVAEDGAVTNFQQADCASPHRFEVALREDLSVYPTSEFGPDAPMPSTTRQAQLREELCGAAALRYLEGRFDPAGRFSIAPILPPASAWAQGDRTMLCGLQETDRAGGVVMTSGKVADQDQARVFDPGQCVAVDASNSLTAVDCAQPHQVEVTSTVNLATVFPDHTPSVEEQDRHLADVCTTAAQDYLGGEENLYRITLQPFWTTLNTVSWDGGSRSVNCALVFSRPEGGFAELTGSATQGREHLLIDAAPPAERPDRRPLREPQQSEPQQN